MSTMACRHPATPALASPAPLFQIRHGYRAKWHDLSLSVESGSDQWTLRVAESGTHLYTAHRSNARAAQTAALEYALFRMPGGCSSESPERLARELTWTKYW